MKTFLTTVKGKVIAGLLTLGVIGAVVASIVLINAGYRTIAVEALNGVTNITNGAKKSEAYVGLHLKSGDEVLVSNDADLTLAMDEDKHVYAEPNTHFWVVAKGKPGDTRTDVKMDAGSNLFRIDNKLTESEHFNVDTPNATMSVRGTVFRVSCYTDEDGKFVTLLEVFEGEVYIERLSLDGQKTGESKIIKAGECVRIRNEASDSEFVVGMDSEIEYKSLTEGSARFLAKAIDAGRLLSIEKAVLFDYVGINEHIFSGKVEEVLPTCTENGYYYEICEVCGVETERKEIPKIEHDYYTEEYYPDGCNEEGYVIKKCRFCDVEVEEETVPAEGHVYSDEWTVVKAATCITEGERVRKCLNCDEEIREVIRREDHHYGDNHLIVAATYNTPGLLGKTCEFCNTIKMDEAVIVESLASAVEKETKAAAASYVSPQESSHEDSHEDSHSDSRDDDDDDSSDSGSSGGSTPPHQHSYTVEISRNDPDCINSGRRVLQCSGCSDTTTQNLPATGHTVLSWNPTPSPAGGAANQTHEGPCTVCSTTVTEPHTYGGWIQGAGGYNYKECTVCSDQADRHSFRDDGTGAGNCADCGMAHTP